jgi:hypothetical protein
MRAGSRALPEDLPHRLCPGVLNGMIALANATTNGFPMIQIGGSSESFASPPAPLRP